MDHSQVTFLKEKKYDIISVALGSDGIMYVHVKANSELDVQHVKLIVETIEDLGDSKIFPVLIVLDENTLPTPEARLYVATPESDPYASAEAYVIKSLSQKIAGNFYMKFNKPARPTKMFNEEDKAIEWLKTFLK